MSKIVVLDIVDESAWIEACRRGDSQALRQLYMSYYKKMLAVCIRYVKEENIAWEVLNDAFLKIFEKFHLFKGECKLEFWVKRIVVNTIIDHIRKNKSYRKHFIHTDEFVFYGKPDEECDDISQWWEQALDIPAEELFKLVSQLPPATRTVFNLYAIDEFTHQEIAKQLRISEGTSKWHLANARRILKEKIIEHLASNTNQYENRQNHHH